MAVVRFSPREFVFAAIAVALGVAAALFVLFLQPAEATPSALINCVADDGFDSDPRCIRSTVKDLLTRYPAAELMYYITASTTPEKVLNQCHPIGHIIGSELYTKTGSIEQALLQCTGHCRTACIHGTLGEGILNELGVSYAEEDIAHADLARLRELGKPYCDLSSNACHGIGHVAYLAAGNSEDAAEVCDSIARGWSRDSCYQGVFMERAGTYWNTLFPGATLAVEQHPGSYTYPCSSLPGRYRYSCYLYLNMFQWPLFKRDGLTTNEAKLEKATEVCESLDDPDRVNCFSGIGNANFRFGFDSLKPEDILPLCNRFPRIEDRTACDLGLLPQYFYTKINDLYDYCEHIDPNESWRRTVCYNVAFEWNEDRFSFANDIDRMCYTHEGCRREYPSFMEHKQSIPDYRYGLYGKRD